MTNVNTQKFVAGLVAGLMTAALGFAMTISSTSFPFLTLLLGCFVSLPLFLTAFNAGTFSSIIALITATLVLAFLLNLPFSIVYMLILFLPAIYASWLLGVANPKKTQNKTWYPLSSVIFLLTSLVSIIAVFLAVYLHNSPATPAMAEHWADRLTQVLEQAQFNSEFQIIELREMLIAKFIPLIRSAAVYSLPFLIANLYIAMHIANKAQRLLRPRDIWPRDFRLPITGILLFVAAFILSLVQTNTILDICSFIFSATFSLALSLVGLAYLHMITKPLKFRFALLAAVYTAIFTLVFAAPIFILLLLMGIWASIQHYRLKNETHPLS